MSHEGELVYPLSDGWFLISIPVPLQAMARVAHTRVKKRSLTFRHHFNQSLRQPLCAKKSTLSFANACRGPLTFKQTTVYISKVTFGLNMEECQNRVRLLMRLNDPDHKHRPLYDPSTEGINETSFPIFTKCHCGNG